MHPAQRTCATPIVSARTVNLELRRQRCRTVVKNPNRLVSSGPGTPPLPIHDGKSGKILGVRWNGGGTGSYLPETDGLHGVLATHRCDCRPPPMATKATARSRTHAHGAWRLRAHRTWRPTPGTPRRGSAATPLLPSTPLSGSKQALSLAPGKPSP